jgi:CRP-like cAMP-binding protein
VIHDQREARRVLLVEEIFAENDNADGLFIVGSGSVRVAANGENGQVLLTTVTSPNIFGEMGVLDGSPRSGTATAIDLCTVYFLPADWFLDLLEKSTLVSMRLLVLLTQRLRTMNGRMVELPVSWSPGTQAEQQDAFEAASTDGS